MDKGRPDYYITPTHDFTQYTRDAEEKYWRKETRFDWQQNIKDNLRTHLDNLGQDEFSRIFFLVLPMVGAAVEHKLSRIRMHKLPREEDALKDMADCIPYDREAIQQALLIHEPLVSFQQSITRLKDQSEMLHTSVLEMSEHKRLGFIRLGTNVKPIETEAESNQQALELSALTAQLDTVLEQLSRLEKNSKPETERLKNAVCERLNAIEPQITEDLEYTSRLVNKTLQSWQLPGDPAELEQLKDLVLKRQLRGLKDIANHALVVEQSAIAPLTMGIIHYRRYREIQEAMTTFINDEAKHSATFRRFLVEKLEAKEYISSILIKGTSRYMWLARFMPGAGLFLAVIVEAIGAAYLEFFGNEKYMPDKLFCSIANTISTQDETRHMDLCVAMYNELFRRGIRWEQFRNRIALKVMMKAVYGDKTEDHHLIQAFRAFGVESDALYGHVVGRLSQQLARIGLYIEPEELLAIIGRK
ncbi:hypothetical protein BC349_13360 [Flavihumibacter stibioxidans]|uniref:Ferritin-like domain-containing protein n=1 Tax=Flavihumibacter stibioxidans TaxID=1834163 RepID=A0ABR7MAK3_9BACT|nr:hypothetical protein [Flavihumibacter stibioxidans]